MLPCIRIDDVALAHVFTSCDDHIQLRGNGPKLIQQVRIDAVVSSPQTDDEFHEDGVSPFY
jgi:hypothetical protein